LALWATCSGVLAPTRAADDGGFAGILNDTDSFYCSFTDDSQLHDCFSHPFGPALPAQQSFLYSIMIIGPQSPEEIQSLAY